MCVRQVLPQSNEDIVSSAYAQTSATTEGLTAMRVARLCPNATGADIRSVCTEAGMYAIRARRKTVTEKDFLDAVNKVGLSPLPCVCAFADQ